MTRPREPHMGHRRRDRLPRKLLLGCALLLVGASAAVSAQEHDQHQHAGPMPKTPTEVELLEGLSIPDVLVTTDSGDQVRFFSDLIQGRVVVVNFIFTTCTTICPPMGAIFSQLQSKLGDRVGREVNLISVSVDPVTDTPERLRAWGRRFDAGPGWTLVTGDKLEMDRLLKALEVFTPDYEDHSPMVLVGDEASGRWQRAYGLAPPAKLLEVLAQVRAGEPEERP